jgi:hypothetical protein
MRVEFIALVMPVGSTPLMQELVRVVRTGDTTYERARHGRLARGWS